MKHPSELQDLDRLDPSLQWHTDRHFFEGHPVKRKIMWLDISTYIFLVVAFAWFCYAIAPTLVHRLLVWAF